ncbi:hypothetical protein VOLCADRAFT_100784, partial [Volvox carteri f. nagariensis]
MLMRDATSTCLEDLPNPNASKTSKCLTRLREGSGAALPPELRQGGASAQLHACVNKSAYAGEKDEGAPKYWGRLHPAVAELELKIKGQGKKACLQLLRRPQDNLLAQVLAIVDRQLTNRDAQLPQNRHGVSNPAGQLMTVVAAELTDLQVVSVSPADEPGILAVRAAVRLMPAAFDVVIPEPTSRAVAFLGGGGAAAAAAAASVAGALLDVVEILQVPAPAPEQEEKEEEEEGKAEDDVPEGGGRVAAANASLGDVDEAGRSGPYTSTTSSGPVGLKCKLFPYQQRALSWMVWRETQPELGGDGDGGDGDGDVQDRDPERKQEENGLAADAAATAAAAAAVHLGDFASQNLFWRRLEVRGGGDGGQELWVNPYPGGGLRRQPPPPPRRQRVGILAEEMGLGKTVEVIALMLARPPPPLPLPPRSEVENQHRRQHHHPGKEQRRKQSQEQREHGGCSGGGVGDVAGSGEYGGDGGSSACGGGGGGGGGHRRPQGPNLIVTPPSILQQWSYEIANHSNLKVYVYDGLRWHRQQAAEREKEQIKEAKREQRLELQRQKEARRQERVRQMAERAAARTAVRRARQERKRGRSESSTAAPGSPSQRQQQKRRRRRPRSDAAGVQPPPRQRRRRRLEEDSGTESEDATAGSADEVGDEDEGSGDELGEEERAAAAAAAGAGSSAAAAAAPSYGRAGGSGAGPSSAAQAVGSGPGAVAAGPAVRRSDRAPRRRSYAAMQNGNDTGGDDDGDGDGDDDDGIRTNNASAARGKYGGRTSAGVDNPDSGGIPAANDRTATVFVRSAAAAADPTAGASGGRASGGCSGGAPAAAAAAGPAAPSRMQLYHRELTAALYAGTALCPASCDPTAEAAAAVRELLQADVVLTTYSVLKEEVHYSPSNRLLAGLRHEKKYGVPESPLLQWVWWRLISDPYRTGSPEGHSRLAALLKPIMWRNSKAVAAQDHPLPRRVLQVPGQQGHGKRRRGQDRGEVLAQVAGAELHQLRLACVHVQLTRYWQKLGQELALHGGCNAHRGHGGGVGVGGG